MEPYIPFLKWVETQKLKMLERVKKWVAINSHTSNLFGLKELTNVVQRDFDSLQGKSKILWLGSDQKPALNIKKRENAEIKILLCGHLDTVFPLSSSFQTLTEISEKKWKGPGITDMKGGIAILLTALETLENSPFASNLGWEVLLTPDEEIGSPDSASLITQAGNRSDLALVFEPSFSDGTFVSQRMGSMNLFITVLGKPAHVGRDFKEGRSAAFALCRFLANFEKYCRKENLIINTSNIEVKGPLNIVSPKGSAYINIRSFNENKLRYAFRKAEEIAEKLSKDGIEVNLKTESFRPPKIMNENSLLLFEAYQECAQHLHIPFSLKETGGVCDGNLLAEIGIPVLDSAGATGGSLHTDEEYLIIDSLVERAKLASLFLMGLGNKKFIFKRGIKNDS